MQADVVEQRGLTQDLATYYLSATATGAGLATGPRIVTGIEAAAAKVKDALTPEPSKVVLPPGSDRPHARGKA